MERKSNSYKPSGTKSFKDYKDLNGLDLIEYIINLRSKDINYDFMMSTFGSFNGISKLHIYDIIEVPEEKFYYKDLKGKTHYNTNKFTTTIGIFIFNLFIADYGFSELFNGYLAETINKKVYKKIETKLSYAVIEDDITVSQLKKWEDTMQWFMPFEDVLSPNHTEKMITCTKIISKKKAELIKAHQAEIDAGDVKVSSEIEHELLAFAKDYLGDDPCIDTILSGAGGDFDNNFKNMYVMKGAIKNPDPNAKQAYNIVTSNFIDGVSADEYSIMAGSGTQGAYFRGKKTADGGYWEQLFVAAYQDLHLDPHGSDCGTTRHITVKLTKSNISEYMYCYIIKSNGDLELINSKNCESYIGKTVNLRFASMCESKTGICNKCAGELLYAVSPTRNIGTIMSQVPDRLKNIAMKAFHDSTVSLTTLGTDINLNDVFYPFDK